MAIPRPHPLAAAKSQPPADDLRMAQAALRTLQIESARVRLELALTYCQIAAAARSGSPKRSRNIANAKKAHLEAVSMLTQLRLSAREAALVKSWQSKVNRELALLRR